MTRAHILHMSMYIYIYHMTIRYSCLGRHDMSWFTRCSSEACPVRRESTLGMQKKAQEMEWMGIEWMCFSIFSPEACD